MQIPSQVDGRATYTTKQIGAGNATGNLGKPALAQQVDWFEQWAFISGVAGMLPLLGVAFHPATPINTYVLLLDQKFSAQDPTSLIINGDPALLTLGPTMAIGATMLLSESEVTAVTRLRAMGAFASEEQGAHEYRGLPFDQGCVIVLSSTPGILTRLTGPNEGPPLGGARFTVQWQACG